MVQFRAEATADNSGGWKTCARRWWRVVRRELMEREVRSELVERILAAMPRDDAIRAGLVCQEWHKIVSSPFFSKLCSRTLSACDKICFPAMFSYGKLGPGSGLDMKQERWHKLPSLSFSSRCVLMASHKGLLFVRLLDDSTYWVTNPVTGALRGLHSLRPLIKGDEQVAGFYKSTLSTAFLEVAEDGQSYTLLGVCGRKAVLGSVPEGPARMVCYRSGSSSWTLLPSRCLQVARDIDLTQCELCCNCVFSDGKVFGLSRGWGPGSCYFLLSFDVEAMTWECVCKLEQDLNQPKLVVCNSCIMVVVESRIVGRLIEVKRYDPAQKTMVLEAVLQTRDGYRCVWHCSAHGPVLCIMALYFTVTSRGTNRGHTTHMATYNAITTEWHDSSSKEWGPWNLVPEEGLSPRPALGLVPPGAFELGLSTPV